MKHFLNHHMEILSPICMLKVKTKGIFCLPKWCSSVLSFFFFLMTVTFHFAHCWLSFDLMAIQAAKKKCQCFLFSTSWMLRQLLVSFTLYRPCQHQAPLFIDRASRGQTFVTAADGRSQECETHSWFLDALLYSHFRASAQPHVQWEVIWGWCVVGCL